MISMIFHRNSEVYRIPTVTRKAADGNPHACFFWIFTAVADDL
jgi:hypothetical protein